MESDQTGSDLKIRQEFANRFAMARLGKDETRVQRDNMLLTNVEPRTVKFMETSTDSNVQKLVKETESSEKPWTLYGMSHNLYMYMKTKLFQSNIFEMAKWMVTNDWTRWWIMIYIFKILAFFVCMFLMADNKLSILEKLKYVYSISGTVGVGAAINVWGPMVLAAFLFNYMMSTIVNFATGMNINLFGMIFNFVGQIGNFMSVAFFHYQLVTLITSIGFFSDLVNVITDTFTFAHDAYKATTVTGALKAGFETYCDSKMNNFIQQSAQWMVYSMYMFMRFLCQGVVLLVTGGNYDGRMICDQIVTRLQQVVSVVSSLKSPNELINSSVAGDWSSWAGSFFKQSSMPDWVPNATSFLNRIMPTPTTQ
jgi:hypothetical protein